MKETIIHAILIVAIAVTALLAGRFDYECEFGTGTGINVEATQE